MQCVAKCRFYKCYVRWFLSLPLGFKGLIEVFQSDSLHTLAYIGKGNIHNTNCMMNTFIICMFFKTILELQNQ